jgi:predicted transcriptional regulator
VKISEILCELLIQDYMTDEERSRIMAKCQRKVMENLIAASKRIGTRSRMIQLVTDLGVVEAVRAMANKETSGWNDLYLAGLLEYSVEGTIVESVEFRRLFEEGELEMMESDLRNSGYAPRPPQ